MTLETPVTTREKVRVFVTGSCDGLAELREALGRHSEIELVGWGEGVREAAATLTGGHLQVVLHGTRSSGLPEDELAAIREHTQAPVILLASGEASATSAPVSDCRANGGGFTGTGCVSGSLSPSRSDCRTRRSSIGNSGAPFARSKR